MVEATNVVVGSVTTVRSGASRDTGKNACINTQADSCRSSTATALQSRIAVTRSRIAELRQQERYCEQQERKQEATPSSVLSSREVVMTVATPDPGGLPQVLGGVTYAFPLSYDVGPPDEYCAIASIQWFSRTTVHADAKTDLEQFVHSPWDGQFYWGLETEALSSRVWRYIIVVDDIDLSYYGYAESKCTGQVAKVAKCMPALDGRLLVEEDVNVELWCYRYYLECPYVENLCALPAELVVSWLGRYMVHPDGICWTSAVLPARFRYMERMGSPYWTEQVRWERCTLPANGLFVTYQFCCCYGLR